jgi:hypothetical protein
MHKIIFMLNICRSRAEVESEHVSPEMKVNKATTRSGNWRTIMKACDWSKFRGNSLKLWRDEKPAPNNHEYCRDCKSPSQDN